MSGNSTAGPNKMHLGNKGSPHSGTDPQTNAQTLRRVEAMLDAASAETLDVDALEALLDDLQERAPVMEDFDAGSILPELERSHPALFEQEEPQAAAPHRQQKGRPHLPPFSAGRGSGCSGGPPGCLRQRHGVCPPPAPDGLGLGGAAY